MSVYKRGNTYWYKFQFNGQIIRESAKTNSKTVRRFYDARHSFVTKLATNPAISEETIRQLAGHVSPRMLGRYAHIRAQARRDAIATLEAVRSPADAEISIDRAHNRSQSNNDSEPLLN